MTYLAWRVVVLGVALGGSVAAGCDGGAHGGSPPDAGALPDGGLPPDGGPAGSGGGTASVETTPIVLPPGSICDPSGWCWYNPRPTGDLCVSASGTSDADLWISCGNSNALHFDGRAWRPLSTATTFTEKLWSFSPTDVWAIGGGGSHYDGVAFTRVPELDQGGTDIWGSSANDIYVTGGTARHFDGHAWTDLSFSGWKVAGSGADDVWIADFKALWRFDGTSFTSMPASDNELFIDLAVAARNDVWLVSLVSEPTGSHFDIRRFDGTSWTVVNQLPFGIGVRSITASAPDDIWIAATDQFDPFVIHWDGQFFEEEVGLTPIWTVERIGTGYLAVGDNGKVFRRALVDSPWRELSDGPVVTLNGVWGSAPRNMFAVGEGGTILHYDGREVSHLPTTVDTTLFDVWGSGPNTAWAVGAGGVVVRWDGVSWKEFRGNASTDRDFFAVYTAAPGDVWVGGDLNALFRIVGDEPGFMGIPGLPEGVPVRDIHGTAPDDIWAVAGFSQLTFVSHFDGQSWSAVESIPMVTTDPIWRVWALGPNDVWLRLGPARLELYGNPHGVEGFEYWHFDGQTWSPFRVALPVPDDIWMFGDVPTIQFQAPPINSFSFGRDDIWSVSQSGRWLRLGR